jgi:hypothetical protein
MEGLNEPANQGKREKQTRPFVPNDSIRKNPVGIGRIYGTVALRWAR